MKFHQFAQYLVKLEGISSRNEMVVMLAEMFKILDKEEIKHAFYLMQARVAPLNLPIEFNFSVKLLLRALAVHTKKEVSELEKEYKQIGDIGELAYLKLKDADSKGPSINYIFAELTKIALTTGKNSQQEKQNVFLRMLAQVNATEAKYLARIAAGKLRLGLSDKTILDALSWAVSGDKSKREEIERAFGVRADLGLIGEEVLTKGMAGLGALKATAGVPLASKLVEREKQSAAIFDRMGKMYIQPKYDGLRAQIHYSKAGFNDEIELNTPSLVPGQNNARVFSRNMENMTEMLLDIAAEIATFDVDSIIIDSEAIGYDAEKDKFFPFQETIKRKRKHGVGEAADSIPLRVFAFDILMLNGKDLLSTPLEERLDILKEVIRRNKSEMIVMTETPLIESEQELEKKFRQYISEGLEGLIAKAQGSKYEPGTRNYDWIKLKAASQSDLADTVDAVVLGYYKGEGARAKFGIGAILIGLYDDESDRYISLAKVGTGMKDADWTIIKDRLEPLIVDKIPDNVVVDKNLVPDVVVIPEVTVVVEADEISQSKLHGVDGAGLSLRFPRLKLFDRKDKHANQITTVKELQRIFELQIGKRSS